MKILIACEYSGVVRDAFRKKGHDAWSCDILPCDRNPKYHFKEDVLDVIKREKWDLMIAHPPCTHLAVSGARHFKQKIKDGRQQQGIDFFMEMINADIPKIAVENPVCIMSTKYRKPDQIIQPYMFGDPYKKTTCLWLKNLPKLKETNLVEVCDYKEYKCKNGKTARFSNWINKGGKERQKNRSKTFQGIADAMSCQWG